MTNLKLNIRLSAYTKGIIPDTSKFIEDAPNDASIYGRKDNEWVPITDYILDQQIVAEDGSGLEITHIEDSNKESIRIRQVISDTYPAAYEEDTTYYIWDDTKPEVIISGGTAFSDTQVEYKQEILSGNASTREQDFRYIILPLSSKGE